VQSLSRKDTPDLDSDAHSATVLLYAWSTGRAISHHAHPGSNIVASLTPPPAMVPSNTRHSLCHSVTISTVFSSFFRHLLDPNSSLLLPPPRTLSGHPVLVEYHQESSSQSSHLLPTPSQSYSKPFPCQRYSTVASCTCPCRTDRQPTIVLVLSVKKKGRNSLGTDYGTEEVVVSSQNRHFRAPRATRAAEHFVPPRGKERFACSLLARSYPPLQEVIRLILDILPLFKCLFRDSPRGFAECEQISSQDCCPRTRLGRAVFVTSAAPHGV